MRKGNHTKSALSVRTGPFLLFAGVLLFDVVFQRLRAFEEFPAVGAPVGERHTDIGKVAEEVVKEIGHGVSAGSFLQLFPAQLFRERSLLLFHIRILSAYSRWYFRGPYEYNEDDVNDVDFDIDEVEE